MGLFGRGNDKDDKVEELADLYQQMENGKDVPDSDVQRLAGTMTRSQTEAAIERSEEQSRHRGR